MMTLSVPVTTISLGAFQGSPHLVQSYRDKGYTPLTTVYNQNRECFHNNNFVNRTLFTHKMNFQQTFGVPCWRHEYKGSHSVQCITSVSISACYLLWLNLTTHQCAEDFSKFCCKLSELYITVYLSMRTDSLGENLVPQKHIVVDWK